MDQPLNLNDSRPRPPANAESFIRQFADGEPVLQKLVEDLAVVREEFQVLQGPAGTLTTAGVASGGARVAFGISLGLLVCVAPLIGGLGLPAAAAILGGVTVAVVNVCKLLRKNRTALQVERLIEDFMKAVGPMRATLRELRAEWEALQETSAGDQAADSLQELRELEEILQRVSELRRRGRGIAGVGAAVRDEVRGLLKLIASTLRLSPVQLQDRTLGECIVQSAQQSRKVTAGLHLMKEQLQYLVGCQRAELQQ